MDPSNEDPKPVGNMELLKQQTSACGAGCSCHSTASSDRLRWVLGRCITMARFMQVFDPPLCCSTGVCG